MEEVVPQGKWCSECDRFLWIDDFTARQWDKATDSNRECLDCQDARRVRKHSPRQCITCEQFLGYKAFSGPRWKGVNGAELICKTCVPKRLSRKVVPGQLYPCTGCQKTLPEQDFRRTRTTGHRSQFLMPKCRKCQYQYNVARYFEQIEATPEYIKTYNNARYDYAFARDVLGLNAFAIVEWIGKGYPDISSEVVKSWAGADIPPWEPDPLINESQAA